MVGFSITILTNRTMNVLFQLYLMSEGNINQKYPL